jgi:hypothetical protein
MSWYILDFIGRDEHLYLRKTWVFWNAKTTDWKIFIGSVQVVHYLYPQGEAGPEEYARQKVWVYNVG